MALAVDVALSVTGATVSSSRRRSCKRRRICARCDETGVELAVSARPIAGSASVDVALVDRRCQSCDDAGLEMPKTMRLVRRTLATENAIWVFSYKLLISNKLFNRIS